MRSALEGRLPPWPTPRCRRASGSAGRRWSGASRFFIRHGHRHGRAAASATAAVAFYSPPFHGVFATRTAPSPSPSPSPSPPPLVPLLLPTTTMTFSSSSSPLYHIVFGIPGSAHLWPRFRHNLRLCWHPGAIPGHVWLDDLPKDASNPNASSSLPPIRLSSDISHFCYTNPVGHPSDRYITRILIETLSQPHLGAISTTPRRHRSTKSRPQWSTAPMTVLQPSSSSSATGRVDSVLKSSQSFIG